MQFVKDKIGNAEVIFCANDITEQNTPNTNGREQTSMPLQGAISSAFEKAKDIIFNIASEFEKEMETRQLKANKFEIEFDISLSTNANIWIVGANNSSGFKVTMSWEKDERGSIK